jgi:hypothetical protein
MSDPNTDNCTMATRIPWTQEELEVFAYLKTLADNRIVTLSSEAEPYLRRKFVWVTTANSYRLAMTYGRNRQKIDAILTEMQRVEDPENVQTNCCRTCEATS